MGNRPWTQLERLIQRLPRHSHYKAACASDEELAKLTENLPSGEVRVPIEGYTPEAERLDAVFDSVMALRETVVAIVSNGKHIKAVRAPRPETALQRLKKRRNQEKLDAIVLKMTGGR